MKACAGRWRWDSRNWLPVFLFVNQIEEELGEGCGEGWEWGGVGGWGGTNYFLFNLHPH